MQGRVYARMQGCRDARTQGCKDAGMRVRKDVGMQDARMQVPEYPWGSTYPVARHVRGGDDVSGDQWV